MKKILIALILFVSMTTLLFANAESQQEQNKKTVVEFYNTIINKKDFNAGLVFIGKEYIQHNPLAADGTEGLKNYIKYLSDNFPAAHSEVKRVFAEGDYVILHVHSILEPGTRGNAIVDIFHLQNGKIVEHWDVIQPIPEKSANANGMF